MIKAFSIFLFLISISNAHAELPLIFDFSAGNVVTCQDQINKILVEMGKSPLENPQSYSFKMGSNKHDYDSMRKALSDKEDSYEKSEKRLQVLDANKSSSWSLNKNLRGATLDTNKSEQDKNDHALQACKETNCSRLYLDQLKETDHKLREQRQAINARVEHSQALRDEGLAAADKKHILTSSSFRVYQKSPPSSEPILSVRSWDSGTVSLRMPNAIEKGMDLMVDAKSCKVQPFSKEICQRYKEKNTKTYGACDHDSTNQNGRAQPAEQKPAQK